MRARMLCRLGLGAALALAACRPTQADHAPEPLPVLPVYQITPGLDSASATVARVPDRDPFGSVPGNRVTLTTNGADVRPLLLWLAEQAGISLIVAPDVRARVTVHFENVPAADALRAVIAEAGLSVLTSAIAPRWPPVVFHQLPVNINEASVPRIVERFGISEELARWIVETRSRP